MGNEINTGKKTVGEFTIAYQRNGMGGCTPVIDGKPVPSLTFGYVTESDKNAAMRLIEEALKATNGDIWEAQRYMMKAVATAAAEIKPDEAVEVNGNEILISYEAKKAYLGTEVVADLEDMGEVEIPNEAIKALLISRTETELERRRQENIRLIMEFDDEEEDY